jgi:hypothetical protein
MAGKIFYRERIKVGVKDKKPRFKLVAVAKVRALIPQPILIFRYLDPRIPQRHNAVEDRLAG